MRCSASSAQASSQIYLPNALIQYSFAVVLLLLVCLGPWEGLGANII